jgi:hypothetical protein
MRAVQFSLPLLTLGDYRGMRGRVMARKLTAEFLGTAILVFIGVGAATRTAR